MELLLLSSSVALAKWVLCLKGKNSNFSPSSSTSTSRIILGTCGDQLFFFFNILLYVPTTNDLTLSFLGDKGEGSSSCDEIGGTLYSSTCSSSTCGGTCGYCGASWAWCSACSGCTYSCWGTWAWVVFLALEGTLFLLLVPWSALKYSTSLSCWCTISSLTRDWTGKVRTMNNTHFPLICLIVACRGID